MGLVKEETTQDLCLPCEDTGRRWPWQARSQLDHGLSSLQNCKREKFMVEVPLESLRQTLQYSSSSTI